MNFSNVKIASGASESGVLDLHDQVIVAIVVPDEWTAANITFLASNRVDGTFDPVYDAAGTELEVTAAASRHIVLAPDSTRSFRFLKLRSGTAGTPVNQGADRTLRVALASAGAS